MLTVTAMFCHIQALSLIPHMLVTDMPDLMVLNKVTFLSCANVGDFCLRKLWCGTMMWLLYFIACYACFKTKNENFVNDEQIFPEIALEEVDGFPLL